MTGSRDLAISLLLVAGGLIYLGLGGLHALYAWRGGLGFHFSHSLGAIGFALLAILIGIDHGHLTLPRWVLPTFAVWSALYALLAWRYWFRIPQQGTALATAAFLAAAAIGAAVPRATADPAHGVIAGPRADPALTAAIEAQDDLLFAIVFETCNLEALDGLLADDLEFVHDKWGQTSDSRAKFVADIKGMCERRAAGTDVRARRERTRSEVLPLANYGALHQGEHRFWGLEEGQPPVLRETGRFFHLWRQVDGRWRLARVTSYDHRPAAD
jgi:hypothetical protein